MNKVFDDLIASATTKEGNAKELIGIPGPGIDIIIKPTDPLSGQWNLTPLTNAGRRFINLNWPSGINSNSALAQFKSQCADWGLATHTDWGSIVDQRID